MSHVAHLTSVSSVAVVSDVVVYWLVVVMCVISEAAGKAADRQKGKAVVRQTDRQFERKAVRRCNTGRKKL